MKKTRRLVTAALALAVIAAPVSCRRQAPREEATIVESTESIKTYPFSDPDPVPIFVKLAPDLSAHDFAGLIEVCEETGVSGLVATNTTTAREFLHPSELHLASQAGGLSGAPLTRKALRMVEATANRTQLPIMGVGGIMTPADAQAFFDAGALLVQLYTGFIFNGPALVRGINTLTLPDRARR